MRLKLTISSDSKRRIRLMPKLTMTREEWLKDQQENGSDGTGYCDYYCEGCHDCAGKKEEEVNA